MVRFRLILLLTVLTGIALGLAPLSALGPKRFHEGETQKGTASWYGSEQQGNLTSNGERFDKKKLTAAHRYLPFNTIVRVTNRTNGNSVEVRINDRGPWKGGRIIDVSEAAADILDMKRAGTIPVEIEIIELGSPGRHNG